MAKTKGGLGRGLNSLLGGTSDSGLPQEKASPVERVTVDSKTSDPVKPTQVKEREPERSQRTVQKTPPVSPTPKKQEERKAPEEVYSSRIDNVTIKGVVERETRPAESKELKTKPLPTKKEQESKKGEEPVNEVDIDRIKPNPNQPRTNFKKEELEELAASIKKNGLLSPILVREMPGGDYQIIAGERRWQACKSIGLKKVPVYTRKADDDETIMLALIENIQRSDLNPIEEAYGYRRMMERGGMTQSEVALAVSKGRSTIANALRLLELPEDAQQLLFEEKITAGHARAILSVPSKEARRTLIDKLKNEQLSVRETESIARLLSGKKEKKKEEKPPAPKSYKTVARTLRETLDTIVRVKSVKGKNKIEIEFKDEADLQRLFRIIAKPTE